MPATTGPTVEGTNAVPDVAGRDLNPKVFVVGPGGADPANVRLSVKALLDAEEVQVLSGWERSRRARAFVELALLAGIPVFNELGHTPLSTYQVNLAQQSATTDGYLTPAHSTDQRGYL